MHEINSGSKEHDENLPTTLPHSPPSLSNQHNRDHRLPGPRVEHCNGVPLLSHLENLGLVPASLQKQNKGHIKNYEKKLL